MCIESMSWCRWCIFFMSTITAHLRWPWQVIYQFRIDLNKQQIVVAVAAHIQKPYVDFRSILFILEPFSSFYTQETQIYTTFFASLNVFQIWSHRDVAMGGSYYYYYILGDHHEADGRMLKVSYTLSLFSEKHQNIFNFWYLSKYSYVALGTYRIPSNFKTYQNTRVHNILLGYHGNFWQWGYFSCSQQIRTFVHFLFDLWLYLKLVSHANAFALIGRLIKMWRLLCVCAIFVYSQIQWNHVLTYKATTWPKLYNLYI